MRRFASFTFSLRIATLLLGLAGTLRADTLLRAPTGPLVAGTEIELALVFTNDANEPVEHTPPAVLPVVLRGGATAVSAVFRPGPGKLDPVAVPPGGFRRTVYRGVLPADLRGLIVVESAATTAGLVALEVRAPHPGDGATLVAGVTTSATAGDSVPPATSAETLAAAATPPSAAPSRRPRDFGISPNEPVYFSVGAAGGLNARFQLSFKFRPLGPGDDRVAGAGPWEDVYAAFTQTSIWDLSADSKPFTDSSYRPSLSYFRHDLGGALGGRFGFAAGFEHESNGKGGADSRSINIGFIRPTVRWGDPRGWQFIVSPKLYAYIERSENPDIARYRGHTDLQFTLVHPESWKLVATGRLGTSGRGSVLIDASFPFDRINDLFPLGWVHGYFHVQGFTGWGENLLRYDQRAETQVRVGFMAIR